MKEATRVAGARLLSMSAARPTTVTTAAELGAPFGRSAEWVRARTGISELRRVGPGESIVDLAVQAGNSALERASSEIGDVDLVLLASCSTTAEMNAAISAGLRCRRPVVALNSARSGFCYGIASADALVRAGQARSVLVLAVEQMSRLVDETDLATSIVFGDGAGAAVVGRSVHEAEIGPVVWGSDGSQNSLIACDAAHPNALRMQGQAVFRWAVETATHVAAEACRRAGVRLHDIAAFVPHQANLRIVDAVTRALDLTHAVVADDISAFGNTSAASVPLALCALIERGAVRAGELALLVGFGAGLAYAAQVVRIPPGASCG